MSLHDAAEVGVCGDDLRVGHAAMALLLHSESDLRLDKDTSSSALFV